MLVQTRAIPVIRLAAGWLSLRAPGYRQFIIYHLSLFIFHFIGFCFFNEK
jgi:hypothetical protein